MPIFAFHALGLHSRDGPNDPPRGASQTFGGTMEHSPSVELNREEAMTLIQIANEGDIGSDNVNEGTVTCLQSLGLVEQRGNIFRSDIEGHAERGQAQAKLAGDAL